MIDGLNEGRGRQIWPDNLAAFLAQIERSPWIAVVLSVRSSYEETIVPEAVRERAANIVHEGFSEHEYDATRTFFLHYELELPSTPLLAPEFRNPLFLKTLCKGLQARGDRRLPRGFQGITAIFDLYLTAINARLADNLDFNPKASLVRDALDALCAALSKSGQRWLPMSTAAKIVDAFLPGRDFARSLYRGLVVEGILMEEAGSERQGAKEEVVLISYERFADHLISQSLLDQHLVCDEPAAAFSEEQPLAFLSDEQVYVEPGLIEALCIQVVERTGHELVTLAPKLLDRQGVGDAFLQSLIWRATSAFSEETLKVVQAVSKSAQAISDTIDVLLTVSTLPGHPLNAEFLDQRLRTDTMAERDAWWSIYLHHAWGSCGPVDRLVDWASALTPDAILEEATIDLSAISLAWMLTTSNRFLRDRATKALVSLLVGRLPAAARFVERFSSVDDPYVTERVYAVAYGVSMRCHSKAQLSPLASLVYAKVFKDRDPPAHLLLRDYARGVVERALHLGAELDIDANRIRPPYQSRWPEIPTEEAIQPLLPDWSHDDPDTRQREWARNRIGSSVMGDDFARYVIGTNSSFQSHRWLTLRIDEPEWKSPPRPGDLLRELISEFSDEEKQAWDRFIEANNTFKSASQPHIEGWLSNPDEGVAPESSENASSSEIAALKQKMEAALETLDGALTEEHARHLDEIGDAKDNYDKAQISPGFDLKQIQRFILSRVFELGWTTERFGKFDHFSIGDRGREASKAERIGKKYQWIAYHEIMALIADHFQYRERYREDEGDQAYEGPWQDYLRSLDPSCTLRSSRGGTGWDSHAPSWWGALGYDDWGTPDDLRTWALRWDDLPPVEKLLRVADPTDGSRWLNVQGHFDWKQQPPNDRDSLDVASRELWYSCTGYLIREGDASAFMKWAEGVDFWGNWMPDAPEVYPMFLGEHGWAPAFRYVEHQHYSEGVWIQPKHDCPVKLHPMAFEYLSEASGFDCSVDDTFRLRLPTPTLISGLGLRWNGDADFSDQSGGLVAQDPTARKAGPSALLLREDRLREFLAREKLSMVWTIAGEKRELGSLSSMGGKTPSLRISGAYLLNRQGPAGFLKCMPDDNPETDATAIKILPSP